MIDGDTIDIHGKRIRLHGIDAPESRQTCEVMGKVCVFTQTGPDSDIGNENGGQFV